MALITPIQTLPNYVVDKLADSDSQSRQREKRKENEKDSTSIQNTQENKLASLPEEKSAPDLSLDPCQQLDTETTVKLLDEQVKTPAQSSAPYETVKNLTPDIKFVREI